MMPKPNFSSIAYYSLWAIVAALFMAANRVEVKKYTPYQLLVWEIKANEGYRSWWYRDGSAIIDGKRRASHSIGFGWNDCGGTRRSRIKEFTRDGKVTYEEALQITLNELGRYGKLHSDPYTDIAMKLYAYNCGKITSPKQLGKCHNGTNVKNKRCGDPRPNVRKAHNRRREFELALRNHNWQLIHEFTERNRSRVHNQIYAVNRGK